VNQIMALYFVGPYPARAAVAVKQLPKDTDVEMDGVMTLSSY
jgi:enamine deaminase RidA (YjgF/YER057c/UK114 family)